jgi:hypothetical protein
MTKKKLTSDEALAKIKVILNSFYADVGKNSHWGKDMNFEILMSEIDNIISKTKIDGKLLIKEQLILDEEHKEHGNKGWIGVDYSAKDDSFSVITKLK